MHPKLSPDASKADVAAMNERAHVVIARMASHDPQRRRTTSCGCLTYRLGPNGPEVLLVKPWSHKLTWGVPKGHVNLDAEGNQIEDARMCAYREVLEETGVHVTVGDELPQTNAQSFDEDKTVRTFLAVLDDPTARAHAADGENVAVAWHSIDRLPPLHAYQVSVVAAALPMIRQRLQAAA